MPIFNNIGDVDVRFCSKVCWFDVESPSCIKHGLHCLAAGKNCNGKLCENAADRGPCNTMTVFQEEYEYMNNTLVNESKASSRKPAHLACSSLKSEHKNAVHSSNSRTCSNCQNCLQTMMNLYSSSIATMTVLYSRACIQGTTRWNVTGNLMPSLFFSEINVAAEPSSLLSNNMCESYG